MEVYKMIGGDANRAFDLKYSGGPMSYSLDYDRANRDLVIQIVPEFRRDPDILQELSPRYPHIAKREQMTGAAYIPPSQSVWGFGPVLTWELGVALDVIRCRIPTKTETANRWTITASLELLLSALKFWRPPDRPERQLTVIGGMIVSGTVGFGNAGIGAYFTPEAAAWIRQQPVGPDIEVTEAIRSLFPGDEGAHDRRYIEVRSDRAGAPRFQVAENCACLHTIDTGPNSPYIQLDSHNIESPHLQLSLLVGLAALNAKIRKALEGKT